MSIPTTVQELTNLFDTVVEDPKMLGRLRTGVESVATVISTILLTEGAPGWHLAVNKALGSNALSESDEKALHPFVEFICKLPGTSPMQNIREGQEGGAAKQERWKGIGIDDAYGMVLDKVKAISYMSQEFAKNHGILKMEIESDSKEDWHPLKPFEGPINAAAAPIGLIGLGTALAEIPVPFRLIVFTGQILLETLRLITSPPGYDMPIFRKLFSATLAVVEFLRGNWKGSLLSFVGWFGQGPMYVGMVFKIILDTVSLISPSLQDGIAWGLLKVTKSAIIGFLLKLFQITATKPVRDKAIEMFTELAQRKNCLDLVLTESGLPRRDADLAPKFENMGTVQEVAQNATRNCSSEFRKAIEVARESIILKLILQIMNIPVTEDNIEVTCQKFSAYMKKEGHSTWYELLVAEGILHQLTDLTVLEVDEDAQEFAAIQAEIVKIRAELEEAKKKEEIARAELAALASVQPVAETTTPAKPPTESTGPVIMVTGPTTVTTGAPIKVSPTSDGVKEPEKPEEAPEKPEEASEKPEEALKETSEEAPEKPEEAPKETSEEAPEKPEEAPEKPEETPKETSEEAPEKPEEASEEASKKPQEAAAQTGGRLARAKRSSSSRSHSQSRRLRVRG